MESHDIPIKNYIGLLQEKCSVNKTSLPEYSEDPNTGKLFRIFCRLGELVTEGTSFSKKAAKQIAAKEMLLKTENSNCFQGGEAKKVIACTPVGSSVSRLNEYASKQKMDAALFSEQSQDEDGLFVYSCKFNGFSSEGKGATKKIAKEKSADLVVDHFKIYQYFEVLEKSEMRKSSLKPVTQQLHEYCQTKKLTPIFLEEKVRLSNKKEGYVVTCKVGDFEQTSSAIESKKMAKMEAASLVLNLLNSYTPGCSPIGPQSKRSLEEYMDLKFKDVDTEETDDKPTKKSKIW